MGEEEFSFTVFTVSGMYDIISEAEGGDMMSQTGILTEFHFRQDSGMPMYSQLAEYLRQIIRSGALKPGERMIAENDVVEILKISRTTVRLAFEQLVKEGLIVRHRGRGTFVAEPQLRRSINYLYSFTENIRASGAEPSSIVLSSGVVSAGDLENSRLGLMESAETFVLERLRMANGEPMIVERTCIPYYLCRGIETVDFSTASLYATLRGWFGLNICRAEETIEAVILKKDVCERLNCAPDGPGYAIERIAYLDNDCICEHTTSFTRADRCVFRLELKDNARTRERAIGFERRMSL